MILRTTDACFGRRPPAPGRKRCWSLLARACRLGDGVPVRVDHVEPVRVDGQPHTFALGYLARFDDRRRTRLTVSVERDDDLAVGAALLDVRQRLESLVEGERLVDDRAEVAGVIEGGQLAQLGTVGLHEQERVAHT